MHNHINHITKLEFLPAFKEAYKQSITEANIKLSFRGAGLVLLNPEAVLSKLDMRPRTPSPRALPEALWVSQTPRTYASLKLSQLSYVQRFDCALVALPSLFWRLSSALKKALS